MLVWAALLVILLLLQRRYNDARIYGVCVLVVLIYIGMSIFVEHNEESSGVQKETTLPPRPDEGVDVMPVNSVDLTWNGKVAEIGKKKKKKKLNKAEIEVIKEREKKDDERDKEAEKQRASYVQYAKIAKELGVCSGQPDSRAGPIPKDILNRTLVEKVKMTTVEKWNEEVLPGGWWRPLDCQPQSTVAIIFPFRDREEQLPMILRHMHPFLRRQNLQYRVFVIEQQGTGIFNKGKLYNAGFTEITKLLTFDCFIFHDVDMVPEDDRIWYGCHDDGPEHLSVGVNEHGYILLYESLVGGALKINRQDYKKINGYSNLYWGWGAEDDDIFLRIQHANMTVQRKLSSRVARYSMILHKKRGRTKKNIDLLYFADARIQFDGVDNVEYDLVSIRSMPLYTHIVLNVGSVPPYSYLRKLIESYKSTPPTPVIKTTTKKVPLETKVKLVPKPKKSPISSSVIAVVKKVLPTAKVMSKKDNKVKELFQSFKKNIRHNK